MKQAFTRVVTVVQSNWSFLSTIFGQLLRVNLHKPRTEQKCNPQLRKPVVRVITLLCMSSSKFELSVVL